LSPPLTKGITSTTFIAEHSHRVEDKAT
jgi:hypothetical protein